MPYCHVLCSDLYLLEVSVMEATIDMSAFPTISTTDAPNIELPGLSVSHKKDECWMRFKASNGREAFINLNNLADNFGSITGSAIMQWIEDVRPSSEDVLNTESDSVWKCL